MKFIKLKGHFNNTCYVEISHIFSIIAEEKGGSLITTYEGEWVSVKENPEVVKGLIKERGEF